jgi:hypothetical protein
MGKMFKTISSEISKPISKQTWHEWSLNGQLSKLYPVTQNSIQDGHHQWT